ncbi:class I SAM-dependent methyltransferase [Candidatus Gracilibacteria bacterium]|nr:class I SAM-dependent methyltransferase [Candidatus Gracilibacteria bacterium]NJP20636.1 class I SAM-dependent methyltransferase [Hydrococcus sp. CRU_1_1]
MSTTSNSQSLIDLIRDRIANSPKQQIAFAEYMNLVLYHPQYGYYSSGKVAIGAEGDFFTSSSLGSDFGELLAEQFIDIWQILKCPTPFNLVEMGAGTGLLASDILSYLQKNAPNLLATLEYIIVEQAEGLIERQQDLLKFWIDNNVNISWKSWQDISEESLVGCLFSNELVDALPVHQIILANNQLKEIYIQYSQDKFLEIIDEVSTPKLAEYFHLIDIDLSSKAYADGYRTEVNLLALDWLKTVAIKLKQGYLLTIDYGYNAQRYYNPQRDRGTLQCYYQHRRHNNPYINIGAQDITTHVDFTALERQGELCGLQKVGFTQQGLFLMALGLGDRLNDLSSGKYNFQQILQRRDALHQLIDPAGLGGFGVLIQSKGLSQEENARSLKGLIQPSLY